jgi:hypothetical protein
VGNRVSQIYDAALVLRASGTPVTSTTSETGIAFDVRKIGAYKAVIQYSGKVYTNETYIFAIKISDLVGGTYTAIATMPDIGDNGVTSGRLDIPLNGKLAESLDADSAFIQSVVTITGAAPSIDYDCFLTKE